MPSHTVAPEKAVIGGPVSDEEQAVQINKVVRARHSRFISIY